jgi:hypothetical protein
MPGDDPAKQDESHDWRSEVDWPHARRMIRWHALYWAFGALQALLYLAGWLTGVARVLIGAADYLAWAALLVMLWRVVPRPRARVGSAYAVSGRAFLLLIGFMASLAAYLVLLALIGLGTMRLG